MTQRYVALQGGGRCMTHRYVTPAFICSIRNGGCCYSSLPFENFYIIISFPIEAPRACWREPVRLSIHDFFFFLDMTARVKGGGCRHNVWTLRNVWGVYRPALQSVTKGWGTEGGVKFSEKSVT